MQLNHQGKLGSILTACRIICDADVSAALAEQERSGCRFGEALLNLGLATQEDIDWALSSQLDISFVRLKQDTIDPGVLELVPADLARRFTLIPLIKAGPELCIAMGDPLDREAVEAVSRHTGCPVNISVALSSEIREMIDLLYGAPDQETLGFSSAAVPQEELAVINADPGGRALLEYLLQLITQEHLSSLSFQPHPQAVTVIARRSGLSRPVGDLPNSRYPQVVGRLHALAASGSLPAPGVSNGRKLLIKHNDRLFEALLLPASGGDYITLRPAAGTSRPSRLVSLALPTAQQAALAEICTRRHGLTLVAGRDAADRNAMLDMMLSQLDTAGRVVILLAGNPGQSGLRFPCIPLPAEQELRARTIMESLEHTPDLLVIDDITGGGSFLAACRAAASGVQVLAGLELRSVRAALQQFLNQREQYGLLPVPLNGLVAVQTVAALCPACRCSCSPTESECAAMNIAAPCQLFRSAGCDTCGHTGLSERHFLAEVLPFDAELQQLFGRSRELGMLESALSGAGSIGQQGQALLQAGVISPEEYLSTIAL